MGKLQALLQNSPAQNMGLQPMLDKKQRESEQLRSVMTQSGQSKAQGITGVANAQAAGIVGQANAGNPWVKAYEGYDARKTTMDTAKAKAEKEAKEAKAKVDAAKLLADAKTEAAKIKKETEIKEKQTKTDVENRRLAMKEFNQQLSEITGSGKGSKAEQKMKVQANKETFVNNYIKDLQSAKEETDPYVVGKTYEGKNNTKAKYLGAGKWDML